MKTAMSQKPGKGYKELRKNRLSLEHGAYFLSAFKDPCMSRLDNLTCFGAFLNILDNLEGEKLLEWFAVVMMPDHFHLVIRIGQGINLSKLMQRIKGSSSYEINRGLGRSGPVWYKGFHDRKIRANENVQGYVRYLYENPVRKGLVSEASEWEFTIVKWEMFPQHRD